jgi:hypothetical protein
MRPEKPLNRVVEGAESFLIDIQFMMTDVMRKHRATKEQVAAQMGVPVETVSEMFKADADLKVRDVGAFLHAVKTVRETV